MFPVIGNYKGELVADPARKLNQSGPGGGEPTPEPTLGVKAAGYEQKAAGYEQKAAGFERKAAGFERKAGLLGDVDFGCIFIKTKNNLM